MPHIPNWRKREINPGSELQGVASRCSTVGELVWALTKLALGYLPSNYRYEDLDLVNGAFLGAQQEFARLKVAPYEDEAIKRNGNAYEEDA